MTLEQRARKFKKIPGKKLVKSNDAIFFREIAFLEVLKSFPVQKLIFGHIEMAKREFGQKIFSRN